MDNPVFILIAYLAVVALFVVISNTIKKHLITVTPSVPSMRKKMEDWYARSYRFELADFSVSDDETTLFLQVKSYYNDCVVCEIYPEYEDNAVFIDFEISGEKDDALPEIAVEVPDGCDSVYFSRGENRYKLVLGKDDDGQWQSAGDRYIFTERNFEA